MPPDDEREGTDDESRGMSKRFLCRYKETERKNNQIARKTIKLAARRNEFFSGRDASFARNNEFVTLNNRF